MLENKKTKTTPNKNKKKLQICNLIEIDNEFLG